MFSQIIVKTKSPIQSIMHVINFVKIASNSKRRADRKHRTYRKVKQ